MQEFGSSLGKPSFRGGRRDGDGLVFVNLGVVPKVRNMLGCATMPGERCSSRLAGCSRYLTQVNENS